MGGPLASGSLCGGDVPLPQESSMPAAVSLRTLPVVLLLLFSCGGGTPCRFDADCPYPDLCVEAQCQAPRETPVSVAGKARDAGAALPDAGTAAVVAAPGADAGGGADAGSTEDAGAERDGGVAVDGGAPVDAGAPGEEGLDAGVLPVDAGIACTPLRCADVGATCGAVPDGCGGELACGSCQAPETCGALVPNTCGCKPKTCAELGATCGVNVPDGCGGVIASCGVVPDCGGGQWSCGSSFTCQCAPKTCSSLGATCGENLADGCGGTIPFCGAGLSCGGGQMFCDTAVNRCACRPKTCADLGATCGVNLEDGCGGVIAACGVGTSCGPFQVCGQQLQCVCASSTDAPDDAFEDTNCDGVDGNAAEAIFVSASTGSDLGSGSRARPVASLARALQLAASSGKKALFIAQGTYAPPPGWSPGVKLYGGYDTSWSRSANPAARAIIATDAQGWLVQNLTAPTLFERVVVRGVSAGVGQAAHGLRLVDSGSFLTLRHVAISAGAAGNGANGANGAPGAAGNSGLSGAGAVRGAPSSGGVGGAGGLALGVVAGGGGGAGAGGSMSWGAQGTSVGSAVGGPGGESGCKVALNGHGGTSGTTPARGLDGAVATGVGLLGANGLWWPTAASGAAGQAGSAGSGGSGGGGGGKVSCFLGAQEAGGGGGGGGAGGAGGTGGAGGQSGGTSIALALVRSAPSLTNVELSTGGGGRGGAGGLGGAGGAGGYGGVGGAGVRYDDVASGNGGSGGRGGAGSAGGRGGDGAPGGSVGIWCFGVSSPVGGNGTTFALGAAGTSAVATGLRQPTYGCP
jgi:hypothetical protein